MQGGSLRRGMRRRHGMRHQGGRAAARDGALAWLAVEIQSPSIHFKLQQLAPYHTSPLCFQRLEYLVVFYSSVQLTRSSSSTVSIFRDSVRLQQLANKPWTPCRFSLNQISIWCCNFHFPVFCWLQ